MVLRGDEGPKLERSDVFQLKQIESRKVWHNFKYSGTLLPIEKVSVVVFQTWLKIYAVDQIKLNSKAIWPFPI
jgi:hypothetical protein